MSQSISQKDMFSETRELLSQWAKWVMAGGKTINILAAMMQEPSKTPYWITDDDALILDVALARLKQKDKETARVTISYFYHMENSTATAEYLRINRRRVVSLVDAGIAWVDAYL